jgi:hypothetical protein
MKKILTAIIGLTAGSMLVHAQGFLQISGSAANVTTNTSYYASPGAGTTGQTTKGAALYDYAVLVSTTQISDGPADAGWSQVGTFAGSSPIVAGGASLGAGEIIYSSGTQFQSDIAAGVYWVEIVGWSSNLGSSWSTVSTELQGGFAAFNTPSTGGYFGYAASSSADLNIAVSAPGGNAVGAGGVADSALVLYSTVPTPEPTTLALAGLGGLSMLFLRRRKS